MPHNALTREPAASRPLLRRLTETRRRSLEIAHPLSSEDMTVQAMDDASPTKWHLAHVTWFFETFLLLPHVQSYRRFDESFAYCFNSYYEGAGPRHPRPLRGLLTRPSARRVLDYREHVDAALERMFEMTGDDPGINRIVEIGINHEQQHQELMLTDILALFAANPLRPAYAQRPVGESRSPASMQWLDLPGGIGPVGHDGRGFAWDNELPRHDVLLRPYRLADRLVTNAEWLAFMQDGGYRNPLLWLADGWTTVQREGWRSPLYWEEHDDEWHQMTLYGLHRVDAARPVSHVSYYEADAFARWAGQRLPTEFEWERAALHVDARASVAPASALSLEPAATTSERGPLSQMFGHVWQWTHSAYLPYPGYRAPAGTLGEYNGKFMVGQHVLRGSSCVTPANHARIAYRNFFYPHQRWQFTGLRLATEAAA